MKKKLTSLILAMLLMVQTLVPGVAFATNNNNVEKTKQNLVKVGELDTKSYPKLDNKTILAIQKQAREKHKPQKRNRGAGLFSADNPYLPGQNPTDQEKAVAYGKVNVNFKTVGLNDNGTIKEFQWKEIFGVDSNGNPTNAKIHFIQRDAKTNKELGRYTLYVNKAGNYKWLDALGKEALLPLYSDKLEPYKYNAALDYQLTDKVKLLTIEISTTKETSTFKKDEKGRNVATISLKLELGQVASTKFVSEWKASLDENSRPNVEGLYATKNKDLDGNEIENLIAFPKKNNDPIQLRNNNYDPENSPKLPYDQGSPSEFRNVPEVKVVQGLKFKDDNDLDGTPTYNIDEDNKIITNLEDSPTKFKFKYELKYDVINGGKLTMTEVIPVTFDANGGKFKNFTAPDTEKQIVKEVDYEGTLADKAENPTKPGKAFKGWATDKDGKNPAKDVDFANLTAAKTFYAIWSDEDIQAEELKTSESLGRFPKKGDPKFTNDFVPTFDQLKAKVKVKNSNGELEPLPTTGVTFSIVDGTKEYTENSDALKKFIYEKVKENKVDEVSRKETVEAKVKYSDGTERKVEIPITVLKNIYKGSDQGNKLPYIPDDYVKVTINPTDKAQDSQKTYYYVNPKAKVEIPRTKNPVGTGDNKFSKWTIKADSDTVVADYTFGGRQIYEKDSTITAQYGTGIVKIVYIDQDGNKIEDKYKIVGKDYPSEKSGGLGRDAVGSDFAEKGPDFKGYVFSGRDDIKGSYQDPNNPNVSTVTYRYTKKVTTEDKSESSVYFKVVFDANGGKFETDTQKTLWVYMHTGDNPVTFEEARAEIEGEYGLPTKNMAKFKEWRDKAKDGSTVADSHVIKVPEWDWTTYPETGYTPETFYAFWNYNEITAEELTVHESFKDDEADAKKDWSNNFAPKLDTLKGQVKIKDASGKPHALAKDDTFAIVDGDKEYTTDEELKTYLYDKLKEKDDGNKPSRTETITAKVTFANGTSQTVEIPIKVIKNIYEAKTLTEKPFYVPDDYVKVTLDPTTKATTPQKTYYYVNPAANVVIPGKDPTGTGDNKFVKWTIPGKDDQGEPIDVTYNLQARHKFTGETTITAQYVSNVIPQEGDKKPDTVPKSFVEVKFVPTDKATNETKAEKIYWVNPEKEVTIPVKDPVGKQYFTFKEWKMGADAKGAVYKPSTPTKFTDKNGTTITATYEEAANIIPFDPTNLNDPKVVRPEGYVKITFETEKGLKLTEQKAYYVKANAKDAQGNALTLGNAELVKPKYSEDTGYKFDKWDKEDTIEIKEADIVVTAKPTKLDNVIPEKDGEGNPNTKPDGYKEVTFVVKTGDEDKGSIDGVAKFYVNPNEYVTINPPTTKANTGFEFGAWDKDATTSTVYKEDAIITGSFNGLKDVIPKTKDDDSEKPDGYKTVTFVIEGQGGKIADKEVTVYYVNPAKDVTVPQPKTQADTGYKFEKWDSDTTTAKKYTADTTVKGSFTKRDDIIPSTKDDGTPNAKPEGYVTVTFEKGANGKSIEGQTVYYVNPEADPAKTLGDKTIVKPTVKADTGYKFTGWNFADTKAIQSNITVIAQYKELDDVIPKTKDDDSEKPDGYITVTFSTETNGKIKDTADVKTKVVYVNPNKAHVLKPYAPEVTPNTGFDFADWDTSIDKAIQYKDKDVIKAKYNVKGDVIPQEKTDGSDKPAGYLTVTFDKGANGELSGKTVYYVKPNTKVTVPAPTVKPAVGYEFEKWDKELTQTFAEDTKITAGYKALENIIPQEKTDGSDRPNGYVTVTFKADANGSLTGKTVYYVKPNVDIDLTDTASGITKKANVGYTAEGGTWNPVITSKTYTENAEYTFNFVKLDDVIPEIKEDGTKNTQPKDYVKVTLIPTDKATDATNKVYFVNPKAKNVTIKNKPEGKKETINGIEYTYVFNGWKVTTGTIASWANENINGKFIQDTEITAQYSTKVGIGDLVPAPVAKKDVVTPKGDTPKPEDLIENIPGNEKDPLPEGTKITYEEEPKVDNPGDSKAKVKIEYPGGKTVVVEVPITVVDNVIPQKGTEKPKDVPNNFVEVKFVPTDKATDSTPQIFWVNPDKEVTIPVTNPNGKQYFTFKEWKIGEKADGDVYNPNTPKKFEAATTITATYDEAKNIIPYDPSVSDPMARPEGYVRVTFKAEEGLKLTEQKAYYVKKNAGIKLGDAGLVKPAYKEETGYKFDKWDKDDSLVIEAADIVVTAKATKLDNVIPEKDEHGKQNEKPEGYITVTFSAEENGKLKGNSVYYVNPNEAVVLQDKAPEVTPNTGFDFAGWDISIAKAIKYNDGDVIKAKYNEKGDVIPQENPDGSDKPAGYLTVTFDKGDHGELSGKTVYYVKPNKEVTVPAPTVTPNAGFEFEKWDKELTQTFKEDTTITAQYKKSTGTTPGTNPDQPGDKPGDNPGGTTPGGTTPGTNPETPGENPETPGTVPENPGAIPGTKPGVVEKHGNRYVERVAGKNRVHTAISTSKRFFKKSKYVIIADSGNYPDALTATVLAHVLDAPILLNNTRYLEDDVAREIVRLGATEVIIVGGHKSISENVKSQLAKFDANKVQRIWGRDRYVTSSELAYEIERLTGKVNKAIIASGENFPDALATAPLGSKEIAPILLVTRNQMDKKVSKALKDLNINKVYVAGGQNSVSKKLEAQLPQVIRRFSGQDRYETAILVASYTYPESKEVFVASGETFPDALVIGPVCARRKAPILLSKSTPVKVTDDYIEKSKIEYLYIIGGTNTIHVDTAHKYAIEDKKNIFSRALSVRFFYLAKMDSTNKFKTHLVL